MFKNFTELDIKTLVEFANNNMDLSKTARKLFLSRTAAAYHLEKIKNKTGLDPLNFYDLVQLLKLYNGKEDINESN